MLVNKRISEGMVGIISLRRIKLLIKRLIKGFWRILCKTKFWRRKMLGL